MSTPPGEPARYPIVLAVFAAITFFALVVCAFGFISLFTDLEVIDEPDAGPLVGPSMVAFALATVLISLLRRAASRRPTIRRAATPGAQPAAGAPAASPSGRSDDSPSEYSDRSPSGRPDPADAPSGRSDSSPSEYSDHPSAPPLPGRSTRGRPDPARVPLGWAVLTGLATYLVYALSGAVLYAATTGSILAGVFFARDTFLGPFAVAAGVAAFAVALVFAILVIVGGEHPRRLLWPWERDRG